MQGTGSPVEANRGGEDQRKGWSLALTVVSWPVPTLQRGYGVQTLLFEEIRQVGRYVGFRGERR